MRALQQKVTHLCENYQIILPKNIILAIKHRAHTGWDRIGVSSLQIACLMSFRGRHLHVHAVEIWHM